MTTITLHEDWIDPRTVLSEDETSLIGCDGYAFAVMGFVGRALKASGNRSDVLGAYRREATSGDYDHLLAVSMTYLGEM